MAAAETPISCPSQQILIENIIATNTLRLTTLKTAIKSADHPKFSMNSRSVPCGKRGNSWKLVVLRGKVNKIYLKLLRHQLE